MLVVSVGCEISLHHICENYSQPPLPIAILSIDMAIPVEGTAMGSNSFLKWLFTGSCTIGNWNICGPQTPRANCDREASEKLLHPTPLSDEWEKEGVNHEDRRQDWIACGGNKTGWYTVPTKATGLEYNAESALAHHKNSALHAG